jgi:hypothetical protein
MLKAICFQKTKMQLIFFFVLFASLCVCTDYTECEADAPFLYFSTTQEANSCGDDRSLLVKASYITANIEDQVGETVSDEDLPVITYSIDATNWSTTNSWYFLAFLALFIFL